MKFLGSSKITRHYQISLPADVRAKLDVGLGDQIIFVEDKDGRLILTKEIALPD
ncbi:MAG: AbrB/MazE/SpoVT family DNA-binding domain-containing protein [Candidatus Heimdallarchaeota archaeon]